MKTLPPQRLSPTDYASIRKQIQTIFYEVVFRPVLEVAVSHNAQLKSVADRMTVSLKNAAPDTALAIALRSGMIQYRDGVFSGKFSSVTSAFLRRLGARFDKSAGVFRLADSEVPAGIKHEARVYSLSVAKVHKVIESKLTQMQMGLDKTFEELDLDGTETLFKVKEGFEKSASALEVMPTMSKGSWDIISEEYTENLKLYVRKFSEEMVIDLREATQENALLGYRFDRLAAHIEDRYKTSARKAEFLARTETSIFMSNFRKEMFAQAGVRRYRWQTAGDQRVRDDHDHLNGRIFFYNQPPIADVATQTRANPGGIWNCRCVDVPILEPVRSPAGTVVE